MSHNYCETLRAKAIFLRNGTYLSDDEFWLP
jgi:hypothetical protein